MARQINTVSNFILGYVKCELPEDSVDMMVKVSTLRGAHTMKEDWETAH